MNQIGIFRTSSQTAIVFGIDKPYWKHVSVAIASILEHSQGHAFVVFYNDVDAKWRKRLKDYVVAHGSNIEFVRVDNSLIARLPLFRDLDKAAIHCTSAAYYRLFIPELLDQRFSRFLYLDSDLVVIKRIDELLDFDLQGQPVAGRLAFNRGELAALNQKMGRRPDARYINSGVYLANRKLWIEHRVTEKAVHMLLEQLEKVTFGDQCAINYALNECITPLPIEWNVTMAYYNISQKDIAEGVSFEEVSRACSEPSIVHFNGPTKPWHLENRHPWRSVYRRLRRQIGSPLYVADDILNSFAKQFRSFAESTKGIALQLLRRSGLPKAVKKYMR